MKRQTPKQAFMAFVEERGVSIVRTGNRMTAILEGDYPLLLWEDDRAPDWQTCLFHLRTRIGGLTQGA